MSRIFKPWEITECECCGSPFQICRARERVIDGPVICSECETLNKGFDAGVLSLKTEMEKRIAELEKRLATFEEAVAHVTEDATASRSFTSSEGWSMVHTQRLHDLEIIEERLTTRDL